ncbi:hypothetical protein ACQ4WP_28665 [Janthinobacterium sp. GB4P2]|uniref:hypothetical protein n=1 Tax=Janthinobacterium sp. GB4P2 TaxID=3424189 RepID=UPI003F29EB77
MDVERRLANLEENMSIALGRLNAVHSLVVVVARQLPTDVAVRCASAAREAASRIEADLVASPLPESMILEMQRVINEGIMVLDAAAKAKQ